MYYGKILRKEPVAAASRNLAQAAATAYAAYESLLECGMDVADASVAIENIQFTTDAITKNPDTLGAFIADGGLEAFIGSTNIESVEKATASLEGKFGEAMKNFWAKVKEWFARLGDWIRKFFYSLEGELKHLEGMVDVKNDSKFNPDAKFDTPMPTKALLDLVLKSLAETKPIAERVLKIALKVKLPSATEVKKMDSEGFTDEEFMKITGLSEEDLKFLDDGLVQHLEEKIEPIFDDSEMAKNPPSNPIEALNQVLKSGTAAELGYKTASDVRDVVRRYTALVRSSGPLVNDLKEAIKKIDAACDQYTNLAEVAGVKGVIPVFKTIVNGANVALNKYYTKLIRWELMLVTRVVRKMYSK